MRVVAISFSKRGAEQIANLKKIMNGIEIDSSFPKDADKLVAECFSDSTPILFVCAVGIAVRLIAPYIKDKLTDPPVLVMDEAGEHVIPILSGHVGGANELAKTIADAASATPVITTATDVNSTFSIDTFARENRLTIKNRDGIKKVSSQVLKGEPIRIQVGTDFFDRPDVVIASEENIHGYTLWLSKKKYVLGIGCKKGKTLKAIEERVSAVIDELGIGYSDIYAFGSIDLKADENGLLAFSQKYRIPFVTFTPEVLQKAKGEFAASDFVKETTGVDNVCERAAMLLTLNRGKIVMGKQALDGVTVAVALRSAL